MRRGVSIGAVIAALTMPIGDVASLAAPNPWGQPAAEKDNRPTVDIELVVAVDVSYSMDVDHIAAQHEGYARAITSKEFLEALKAGRNRKIALTYIEWSAANKQKVIIPWRLIDGAETADALAADIMKVPVERGSRTSISGAIEFALPLFEQSPFHGLRRVIDISGDGPNNTGYTPVNRARDAAVAKGVTINGLPIMLNEPEFGSMDIKNLDWYYEDCVVGGADSFVVPIKDRNKFNDAIQATLVREITRYPERRVPPAEKTPRVSCLIGEKLWTDRWGR